MNKRELPEVYKSRFLSRPFFGWDLEIRERLRNGRDRNDKKIEKIKGTGDHMAIEIRGLAPLLQVFDMPTSVRFYCEGLGFDIVGNDGKSAPNFDWCLLQLNGCQLMLNTAYEADQRPPAPDPKHIAAHEDTAIYLSCPDVDGAYAHLQKKGIKAKAPKVAPHGMKQLYLHDPDGYVLCFQWRAG